MLVLLACFIVSDKISDRAFAERGHSFDRLSWKELLSRLLIFTTLATVLSLVEFSVWNQQSVPALVSHVLDGFRWTLMYYDSEVWKPIWPATILCGPLFVIVLAAVGVPARSVVLFRASEGAFAFWLTAVMLLTFIGRSRGG